MDDKYDFMLEIDDKPNKWVKEGAIQMYLAFRAQGADIPKPLQDYIYSGLQREADGINGFPVTKSGEHNPLFVSDLVKIEAEQNGDDLKNAIDMVAAKLDMTERSIKDIIKKTPKNQTGIVYYLRSYLKQKEQE